MSSSATVTQGVVLLSIDKRLAVQSHLSLILLENDSEAVCGAVGAPTPAQNEPHIQPCSCPSSIFRAAHFSYECFFQSLSGE